MTALRSADHALMREMNIALILECLRREAPLSRAELALMTGLTKATVSSLVKELLAAGYIRENGLDFSSKGRPAIHIVLNPDIGCIIGVELGVGFISVILADFSAKILWRQHRVTKRLGRPAVLQLAQDMIQAACQQAENSGCAVLGLGLGVPGLVDVASGTLLFGPNLGWTNVPLRQLLAARFPFPVYVDNEANLAALGESYFGAARGSDFVLYVSAGIGLGGGIVFNRRILAGVDGLAGEVGHMTIDPDGPRCNCGNFGCWETYVSQAALFGRVRTAVAAGQHSVLAESAGAQLSELNIHMVVAAARQGDPVACAALEETGRYLGLGLANLINALNPERVVFGGNLSVAHEFLLAPMRAVIQQRALRWSQAELVIATHGSDACLMGGIAAIYNQILSQPLGTHHWPAGAMASGAAAPARTAPSRPALSQA